MVEPNHLWAEPSSFPDIDVPRPTMGLLSTNFINGEMMYCQAGTRTSRSNRCPVLYFVWMFSRHGLKCMTTELSDSAGFLVRSQGRPKNWIGMPSSMTLCRLKKCGPL
eukprot:Gb_33526 [translate_table: standard]